MKLKKVFTTYFQRFICGTVVLWIFKGLGAYSIRLAYVFELYIIYFFIYKILIYRFHKTFVVLSIFVSSLYLYGMDYGALNWLSYNDLTSLFYISIIYLVLQKNENPSFLFIAGLIGGVSSFLRITNISSILFFLIIPFDYFYHRDIKKTGISLIISSFGFLLGIVSVILTAYLLGHLPYIQRSFQLTFKFSSLTPVHEVDKILITYFFDILDSIKLSLYFLIFPIGLFLLYPFRKFFANPILVYLLAVFISSIIIFADLEWIEQIKKYPFFQVRWLFWEIGIVYILNFVGIFFVRNIQLKRILFMGFIFLIITPLGSGRTLLNAKFGLFLTMPTLLCIFYSGIYPIRKIIKDTKFLLLFNTTFSLVILFFSFQLVFKELYRDSSNRLELVYPVKSPKLKFLLTTQSRSRAIDSLTDAIDKYVVDCKYLLALDHVAFGNYLSNCTPYLTNPNPMFLSSQVFIYLLDEVNNKNIYYPYILTAKVELDKEWKPVEGGHSVEFYQKEFEIIHSKIDKLKLEGEYITVWENDYFEILRPKRKNKISGSIKNEKF